MMKLYYTANSPYARRVRMAIRVADLLDRVEEIDIHPRDDNLTTLLSAGPGGKVPVLITHTGLSLCESLVIAHYLNTLAPDRLYPREDAAFTATLSLESTASVLMDSLFTRSREQRRVKHEQSPGVISLEVDRAKRCYTSLEATVPSMGSAETMNMATITVIAALDYANWRHPNDNWQSSCPTLASWFDTASQHHICEQTRPVY